MIISQELIEPAQEIAKQRALKKARDWAWARLAPKNMSDRYWYLTSEQVHRFRASANPLDEYPDETETFVAFEYNQIRRHLFAYENEINNAYHRWQPREGLDWLLHGHPYGLRARWKARRLQGEG